MEHNDLLRVCSAKGSDGFGTVLNRSVFKPARITYDKLSFKMNSEKLVELVLSVSELLDERRAVSSRKFRVSMNGRPAGELLNRSELQTYENPRTMERDVQQQLHQNSSDLLTTVNTDNKGEMNLAKLVRAILPNSSPAARLFPISFSKDSLLPLRIPSTFSIFSNNFSTLSSRIPEMRQLLTAPQSVAYTQTAGFKVKHVLKRRCKDCYFVKQKGRMHVLCPTHPRHKQMKTMKKPKYTWIICSASQSKVRPW